MVWWGETMIVKGTDIYLTRGDTAKLTLEINLEPQYEIKKLFFTVKRTVESSSAIIEHSWVKDPVEENNITNPENNTFIVSIDHSDTATQPFGRYRYDVQINYVDSENPSEMQILTIIKPSIFSIEEEVTLEGVT